MRISREREIERNAQDIHEAARESYVLSVYTQAKEMYMILSLVDLILRPLERIPLEPERKIFYVV